MWKTLLRPWLLKWERFTHSHVTRLLWECKQNYSREECIFLCSLFSSGPRWETKPHHSYPFPNLCDRSSGRLWRADRPMNTQRGLPGISANWLCPKTSFSVGPLRKKFWVLSEIPIRGGKTKVMLLFQSPSCRVLVQAAGVWGALCLHSTEVSGWIFRFRVCDVQRTFLL